MKTDLRVHIGFREDFVIVAIGGGQTGPYVLRIQSGNITWTVSGNGACIWLVDVYEYKHISFPFRC